MRLFKKYALGPKKKAAKSKASASALDSVKEGV